MINLINFQKCWFFPLIVFSIFSDWLFCSSWLFCSDPGFWRGLDHHIKPPPTLHHKIDLTQLTTSKKVDFFFLPNLGLLCLWAALAWGRTNSVAWLLHSSCTVELCGWTDILPEICWNGRKCNWSEGVSWYIPIFWSSIYGIVSNHCHIRHICDPF